MVLLFLPVFLLITSSVSAQEENHDIISSLDTLVVNSALALVGLFFLLFGYKHLKTILFINAAILGSVLSYHALLSAQSSLQQNTDNSTNTVKDYTLEIGMGLVIAGIILALCSVKFSKLGLFILGGCSAGLMYNTLITKTFMLHTNPSIALKILEGTVIVTFGVILALSSSRVGVVIATASTGSNAIMMSASFFISYTWKELSTLNNLSLALVTLLITVIGITIQLRKTSNRNGITNSLSTTTNTKSDNTFIL